MTTKKTAATTRKNAWQRKFLTALANHPDVSKACATAGVSRNHAYRTRQEDETFAVAWADAINRSLDELEAALIKRAIDTDTTAAIFLLKSHRPEIYRDNVKIEHTGTVQQQVALTSPSEETRRVQIAKILQDAGITSD